MKRIIFLIILTLACGISVSAQKVWEGTVVAGRYGDFPPTGYYGASNVFPRNSLVNVQNISNGKTVQLIISGGLEDPAMFLIVSRQAADALELQRNDSANARVSLAAGSSEALIPGYADLPYSSDPEVNPAARAGDVNSGVEKDWPFREKKEKERIAGAPVPVPAPGPDPALAPDPAPAPPVVEEPPSISDRVPSGASEKFDIKESPFAELPEERPSISERAENTPRVNEDWVLEDVEAAPVPSEGIAAPGALPVPGEPEPKAETAETETAEPEIADNTESATEPAEETAETAMPETATGTETETIVTLEPAQPKPPVETAMDAPAVADSAAGKRAEENLPPAASLPGKSYYLQVASHRNPESMQSVVENIASLCSSYPVAVLEGGSRDNPLYRVMVGPLKEDERGLLLRQVKAKGYTDAFLREIH
ncbi:MAG: SPOR domain-containing protein [Spirochaetales bacterium]|jgi:hypothetical protein|nr:SPOR domain-containing protein [Spirochaetales bacterium]